MVGAVQVYVVPAILLVGVTAVTLAPEQIVAGLLSDAVSVGCIITVTVNVTVLQAAAFVAVMVYVAVPFAAPELLKAPVENCATPVACATPPVTPALMVGAVHVYVVPAILLVGVTAVTLAPEQIVAGLLSDAVSVGCIITVTVNVTVLHAAALVAVMVYVAVPFAAPELLNAPVENCD
jgi:hypothetical protein